MVSIEELIDAFRSEVDTAACSYYTWKGINDVASLDAKVLQRLHANALVWNTIVHSLQVTFLVVLGRIFDGDNRSLTVKSFVGKCRENIDQFSLRELEARKLANVKGGRPVWLDEYIRAAHQPSHSDFDGLIHEATVHGTVYIDRYRPIRNKVIAHKDFATIGNAHALFGKTNIGEVEDMLLFLAQVERVIHEWFWNGRRTQLTDHPLNRGVEVREQVERLLATLGA